MKGVGIDLSLDPHALTLGLRRWAAASLTSDSRNVSAGCRVAASSLLPLAPDTHSLASTCTATHEIRSILRQLTSDVLAMNAQLLVCLNERDLLRSDQTLLCEYITASLQSMSQAKGTSADPIRTC